jgi:hypothetical protein
MSFVVKEIIVTLLIVITCFSVAIAIVYSIADHKATNIGSSK